MSQKCQHLQNCGFFQKYQSGKNLTCKVFVMRFCEGTEMENCKRKEYRMKHGNPPSDEMMPSGQMMSA